MEENKENKNNNNALLRVLTVILSLIVIFGCGYVAYDRYFSSKPAPEGTPVTDVPETPETPEPEKEPTTDEEEGIPVKYGLLSVKDINPFKNLDFSKRVFNNGEEIDFNSNGIVIKTTEYNEETEEDVPKEVKLSIKNIKQLGLSCMCGGCTDIYYLTKDGELYNISFSHQDGLDSLDTIDLKKSTTLVSKNVKSFALFEAGIIDQTTCGGYNIVFKSNDNKEYIKYDDEIYETYKFKRIVVNEVGFGEGSELFLIAKDIKASNYLKDTNGKNLVAKNIYTFSGETEDGDGEPFFLLYVLNEDNYLYYFEDYIKEKVKLYHDSKVKSIKERDDDILVTFEDGKEEAIDAIEFEIK